jgi:hypothetical protein
VGVFSVRGFSATSANVANGALGGFWNPDSVQRVKVLEVSVFQAALTGVVSKKYLVRTTTRGTAGSTITPDADNAWEEEDIPASGALLDLAAYSVEPTLASPPMFGMCLVGASSLGAGFGYVWLMPSGLWLPPGTGLAICDQIGANGPTSEIYVAWEEG